CPCLCYCLCYCLCCSGPSYCCARCHAVADRDCQTAVLPDGAHCAPQVVQLLGGFHFLQHSDVPAVPGSCQDGSDFLAAAPDGYQECVKAVQGAHSAFPKAGCCFPASCSDALALAPGQADSRAAERHDCCQAGSPEADCRYCSTDCPAVCWA